MVTLISNTDASELATVHALLQPCNPAVGGPAKSQLVHEVDALGGEIGAPGGPDYLQKRVLNRSKASLLHGPQPA